MDVVHGIHSMVFDKSVVWDIKKWMSQKTDCFEMSQRWLTDEIQVFISKTVFSRRWVARLVAYRSCLVRLLSVLNPEAVFKEKRGVWDPMLELALTSPYLIVDSGVNFPPELQRERGGVGKVSPIGWAHLYLSANYGTTNRKRESTRKGEGRYGSWLYVLE
jgi:hypothetical protein